MSEGLRYFGHQLNGKTMTKQKVKILGQTVTVGSKAWEKLTWQVKHFNDLAKNENN